MEDQAEIVEAGLPKPEKRGPHKQKASKAVLETIIFEKSDFRDTFHQWQIPASIVSRHNIHIGDHFDVMIIHRNIILQHGRLRVAAKYNLNLTLKFSEMNVVSGTSQPFFILRREVMHIDEEHQMEVFRRAPDFVRDALATMAKKRPAKYEAIVTRYERDLAVVSYVLRRADGHCEECGKPAPFLRKVDDSPYLEVHHKVPLADDGDDTIENTIALCPNCHRRAHHGQLIGPSG